MSFQWIGIFPNKTEGSPPQVKVVFATSIDKDLVSSNAKKLGIFNNSRKFPTIWAGDLTRIQQDLKLEDLNLTIDPKLDKTRGNQWNTKRNGPQKLADGEDQPNDDDHDYDLASNSGEETNDEDADEEPATPKDKEKTTKAKGKSKENGKRKGKGMSKEKKQAYGKKAAPRG
uniref:Uncharacterized protein n=1 Tax=Romanomermis culicivorax TaxID=13658 RepID=A0A915L5U0_ROMCU